MRPEHGEFFILARGQIAIVLGSQFVVRIRIRRVEARGNFQFAHGCFILAPSPESHAQSAVGHFEFGLQLDGLAKRGFRACRVTARQKIESLVDRLSNAWQKLRGSRCSRLLWCGVYPERSERAQDDSARRLIQ